MIKKSFTALYFIFIVLNVGGCNLRQSFQPLPPMFQDWGKAGVSPEEVKAALLKCGYQNPYTGYVGRVELDERARASQQQGFRYLSGDGKTICDVKELANLPACR